MKLQKKTVCDGSDHGWTTWDVVSFAYKLEQKQRSKIKSLLLTNNYMETFPATLFELFPNLEELRIDLNAIDFLPREIGQQTRLTCLTLKENNVYVIPSTITRLTKLVHLELDIGCAFYDTLPRDHKECQSFLHEMVSHFELARRSATVLVGMRKLKRSQILRTFYVPIELILEIAIQLVRFSHETVALKE
jgi:Leucine-rich repeat (LRR) protein